jgi:hypothetical protein
MMFCLSSEKVAPTGNVTSKGIMNQLGRPNLDLLAVLVRETVQNSWDARASDQEPVHFSMAGWTLSQTQQKFLNEALFAEYPPSTSLPLVHSLLNGKLVNVLAISDRGTRGMGGPTRADIVTRPDEPRDFVDFLRDVGQPSDKQLTGGTYGYGKAALYRASRVRTICVYTRCQEKGRLETRFIATALGEPYSTDQDRYTGRHWWGRLEDNIAEPLLDADADGAAEALGIPKFRGNECGTTILVFQPILNEKEDQQAALDGDLDRTPLQAINLMAEYILWYFWPKMLAYEGRHPAIVFDLSWQGEKVYLPHPVEFPPLQGYVLAMCRLKDFPLDPNSAFRFSIEDIASQRPKQHLGRLALQQFPATSAKYFDTGNIDSPFSGLTHHTALMRQPELVVKYLPGSAVVNEKIGYAGVFITDTEVDAVFANSEPPTHDDWISQSLEDSWHKRFVNAALREIGKKMDSFAKPPAVRTDSRDLTPLGAFATRLGSSLMPAEQGPAATFKPFTVRPDAQARPSQNGQIKNPPEFDPSKLLPNVPVPSPSSGHDSADGVFPGIELPAPGQLKEESSEYLPDTPVPSPGANEGTHPAHVFEPPKYEPQPAAAHHKPKPIIGQARVKYIGDSHVLMDGVPALQFEFSVAHARNSSGTTVQAEARAVLNGSQMENDPPVGGSAARVMYWISPDGTTYAGSDEIFIAPDPPGNWQIIISLPDDMMLGVQFKAEARSAE